MNDERTVPVIDITTGRRGVVFDVLGVPAPQGSKRAFVVGKRAVVTEDSKRSAPWRDSVAAAGLAAMDGAAAFDGPLRVAIVFRMPRPRSVKRAYPSVKPDVDKLARAVLDGLTAGGVIVDDSRVVSLAAKKVYDAVPGATVRVTEVLA